MRSLKERSVLLFIYKKIPLKENFFSTGLVFNPKIFILCKVLEREVHFFNRKKDKLFLKSKLNLDFYYVDVTNTVVNTEGTAT